MNDALARTVRRDRFGIGYSNLVIFSGMTEACNGCHVSIERPFIVIHTPTEQQPLGDQSFSPRRKP